MRRCSSPCVSCVVRGRRVSRERCSPTLVFATPSPRGTSAHAPNNPSFGRLADDFLSLPDMHSHS